MASSYYEKSIRYIDMIRNEIAFDLQKASFNSDKSEVFEEYACVNYEIYRKSPGKDSLEKIFECVEKAKAEAFYESYEETNKWLQIPIEDNVRDAFNKPAVNWNPIWDLMIRIRAFVPTYSLLMSRERTGSRFEKEICPLINIVKMAAIKNVNIAEYFVMDEMTLLIIINSRECNVYRLPPREILRKQVYGYIKYLETPDLPPEVGFYAATRIYREILKPYLEKAERWGEELVVIPDDLLCYLPFEALVIGGTPRAPEYLISRGALSYMPSASSIVLLSNRTRQNVDSYGLIAFGDPDYNFEYYQNNAPDRNNLVFNNGLNSSRLKYSRKEIRNISQYFSGKDQIIYYSKSANEENIRLLSGIGSYIMHIACHSVISDTNPNETGLILSPSSSGAYDGILKVGEIYNLKYPVELIVLSSCYTARGTVEKFEGVLGLSRAYFLAGVAAVISALWAIEDESTSIFMERFYYFLWKGNSLANSLRVAKMEMIRSRYSNPRHWAAFVIYGGIGKKIEYFEKLALFNDLKRNKTRFD